ncbi:MAG TPA: bifunctional diaminohydroxyphosphoribosylaminopyrimidine deaminase/5-amino-6-(5-phosphoribosylamino)uracil reductase RibD [Syntrophales bacterium]|nr:bifunctional diaminohydroxyphosphoribosylaminopyrimidine deaminase/5-amino-6-(5-phosphoribosylamino)uracil reductase RibD [Syntrophales bacterium]
MDDELYMKRALLLAKKGEAWVSPNPMVGCVIVKKDRIIGEGYHEKFGGDHAEINALGSAAESVRGAVVYLNLEPCTHFGKTPPCIGRIIAAKPRRVVIGTADPNPLVSGKGIEALKSSGIRTAVGVLEGECRELNERFFKFMQTGIPFVTVKFAQSLDGRIATASGHSRWISSEQSLKFAHALRSHHDAVLIGCGTLVKDNPELTVRLTKGRNPIRVVVDSHLRISADAKILKDQGEATTVIATTSQAPREKRARLTDLGIEVLTVDTDKDHRVDLMRLLFELGKRNISSVLAEGGAALITSMLAEQLTDRVVVIIAPRIIGKGIESVGDLRSKTVDDSVKLSYRNIRRLGNDLIVDGRIEKRSLE